MNEILGGADSINQQLWKKNKQIKTEELSENKKQHSKIGISKFKIYIFQIQFSSRIKRNTTATKLADHQQK